MPPIHEQLLAAMVARGWTCAQLRDAAGLSCSLPSLSRKLRGKQVLSTDEVQALVNALGVNVVAAPERNEGPT